MEAKKTKNQMYDTLPEETTANTTKDISQEINTLPIIEQILEKKGYDINTLKYVFLVFCIIVLEGLHMSFFSTMLIPLREFYQLSDFEIKFVSGMLFLGVGTGSILSGMITNKYERTDVINICLVITFVSNLLLAINSYITFLIFRVTIGFCLGVIVPTALNLLAECLPIRSRSFVLTCVWVAFTVGQLYLLTSMLILMPNFEKDQVQTIIIITSSMPLVILIAHLYLLEDSPRMLIINGRNEEGLRILERWNGEPINEHMRKQIINEVTRDCSKEDGNMDFTLIFKNRYLKTSILLTMLWFFNSVISYGPGLIISLTLKRLGVNPTATMEHRDIILNQIVMCLISSPSNIIGGALSEIPSLGRNKATILGFFFSAIFFTLCIVFTSSFTILLGLGFAALNIAFNVNTSYSCEVYPTKTRDTALGFLFFATRVGGFLSQFFYLSMYMINMWLPYYFTIAIIIINIGLLSLLPYETYGKPLDVQFEEEVDEKTITTKEV
jgi:putative MFS transporter